MIIWSQKLPKLELYIAYPCPYCILVTDFIKQHNIHSVEIIDTLWKKETHLELKRQYGKTQVPLLLIDGKPMYESLDIIHYLKNNNT